MRLLADAGADIHYRSENGTNVVLAAATSGKLAALELALELLPDPNTVDARGETPLHLLLQGEGGSDTRAMMKLLAAKGARTDIKNRGGRTAADVARNAESGPKADFIATFGERTASLWTDRAKLDSLANELVAEVKNLSATVAANDAAALRAQVKRTGAVCSACDRSFRAD
jgi:ankyrin repeat protein